MINDNTLQLIQIHNVHKNMIGSSYRLHMDLLKYVRNLLKAFE